MHGQRERGWRLDTAAGAASAALALGVAELAAAVVPGARSLVVAVAVAVIDGAPAGIVHLAIDLLGQNDKPVLAAGIVTVALAAGAGLGAVGSTRPRLAAAGFAAFALLGALAAGRDPAVSALAAVAVAVTGAVAGIACLRRLLRIRPRPADGGPVPPVGPGPAREPAATPAVEAAAVGAATGTTAEATAGGAGAGTTAEATPGGEGAGATMEAAARGAGADAAERAPTRRAFLAVTGSVVAVAAASAATGRLLDSRARDGARAGVALLRPARPAPVASGPTSFDVPGLVSPFVTPNDRFYRIDTALFPPSTDLGRWRLRITGMVDHPYELSYAELSALPMVEEYVTLVCVSNEVGDRLVGNALWRGVLLADVLRRAGPRPDATQLVGRAIDGFTTGFPTEAALDGRNAMIAVGMNGVPLPGAHGFPARLIVPGLYGYVSACKWLQEIELTRFEHFDAYWVRRGWARRAPVKTQSRIDTPNPSRPPRAGRVPIAGVAWAPHRGLSKVEVQVDGGAWAEARLADGFRDTWRQWLYEWEAARGRHTIRVRATDGEGQTQTPAVAPPIPDGATGWHTVQVNVRPA